MICNPQVAICPCDLDTVRTDGHLDYHCPNLGNKMGPRFLLACAVLVSNSALGACSEFSTQEETTGGSQLSASIRPGDDFYRHVNQDWLETATIPSGRYADDAFFQVEADANARVREILETATLGAEPGSAAQQVGDLYASFMDVETINSLGMAAALPTLNLINQAQTHEDIARLFAQRRQLSLINWFVGTDSGNSQRHVLQVSQGGLILPISIYTEDDPELEELREGLRTYAARIFDLAGVQNSTERAESVVALQIAIAGLHWSRVQSGDATAMYHVMTREELHSFAPEFPWDAYFDQAGAAQISELVVNNDTAIQALARLFVETPVSAWRDLLTFGNLNFNRNVLPTDFYDAYFDYSGRMLQGIDTQPTREQRAGSVMDNLMGDAIGRLYVERQFPAEAKQGVETMVEYLRDAFRTRLETSDWMSEETREEALYKLENFTAKIGYGDEWLDFSGIEIAADDLYGNDQRLGDWYRAQRIVRLSEAPSTDRFGMSPQIVNAIYDWGQNAIVFPAAILQPPFFDHAADPAANFGAIGAVIGHEMGHGFDDEGADFDGDGNLRNWWSALSRTAYENRTQVLISQYNAFAPFDDATVDGELTLNENIGDLIGLNLAYNAYHLFLDEHHDGAAPIVSGLTGDQRFFIAWARLWRQVMTDEALRDSLVRDGHSPNQYRVNGIVRNMDAWYDAFGIQPGDALYLAPADRVNIW
jgi:putative endopeptidase